MKTILGLLGIVASGALYASGFQLFEGNGTNAGNYGAGGAAEAADASTAFYNPAGLVLIQNEELVLAGTLVMDDIEFTGSSTHSVADLEPSFYTENATDLQGGGNPILVPAGHYAKPLTENVVFGFSVTVPFGLATDWSDTSAVRYEATETKLQIIDFSPALGAYVTEHLSVGLGLDLEYGTVDFNSMNGFPNVAESEYYKSSDPTALDAASENHGTSFGIGAHAGVMYQFTPQTRVGLNYMSEVKHHFTGTSTLTDEAYADIDGDPNTEVVTQSDFTSDNLTSDVTMPATTTLSIFHRLSKRIALMGSVNYTQWSSVQDLVLYNVAGVSSTLTPEYLTITDPQNFKDTWRTSVGANIYLTEKWMLRTGVGYDQTPTTDADVNLRLPDGDRIGVSAGVHYQVVKTLGLDLGWTHLFIQDRDIDNTDEVGDASVTTTGTTEAQSDLVGAQITWKIA